jgi:hypothetical protein
MSEQRSIPRTLPVRRVSPLAAMAVAAAIFALSIWANLAFAITDPDDFRYIPPFKPSHNANQNMHLGAEYYNIARALRAGEGFANPWGEPTGPTAWMPPVYPVLLAGIMWICEDDKDLVMGVVIFLQVYTLIGTGLLVLALAAQTTTRLWAGVAAAIFVLGVVCNYHLWFQFTHDCWLVLLALDVLVAGLCWYQPFKSKTSIALWGACGGLLALISPIVGFAWGLTVVIEGVRRRAWKQLGLALVCAALTMSPWTIRNLLLFGRLIPVKSNAAYELYQSQCLQKDGLLQDFHGHPYAHNGMERLQYKQLGEMAFLDVKREKFWTSVKADPEDFLDRVAARFFGALLWYEPFSRNEEPRRPFVFFMSRLTHPLPFLSLLLLAFSAAWMPLRPVQWAVGGVYLFYLFPYIGVSYYDRYAIPLLGVKILLVLWAVDRVLTWVPWPRKTTPKQQARTEPAVARGRSSAITAAR